MDELLGREQSVRAYPLVVGKMPCCDGPGGVAGRMDVVDKLLEQGGELRRRVDFAEIFASDPRPVMNRQDMNPPDYPARSAQGRLGV